MPEKEFLSGIKNLVDNLKNEQFNNCNFAIQKKADGGIHFSVNGVNPKMVFNGFIAFKEIIEAWEKKK